MTAEKTETNETPTNEAATGNDSLKTPAKTTARGAKKEVVALSVKNPAKSSDGTALTHHTGLPGNRPIGTSHLIMTDTGLPGGRPIEKSHLHVISTYNSFGSNRPVTAGEMEISGTMVVSGNRPISVSHLNISDTYSVMGNRPVASNEIDDPALLMGFLD